MHSQNKVELLRYTEVYEENETEIYFFFIQTSEPSIDFFDDF